MSLQTYCVAHGKSQRFLIAESALQALFYTTQPEPLLEMDLANFACIYRNRQQICLRLSWLQRVGYDQLRGYQQWLTIPLEQMELALTGATIRLVCADTEKGKAVLRFSNGCHAMLSVISRDKLKRHALRKFLRDNLNYGDETLTLYADTWYDGFYFQSNTGYNGGIVPSETTVMGRDGKRHRKVAFNIHT